MNLKKIIACERKSIDRMSRCQLPHRFKKIGWILFLISFVSVFVPSIVMADDHLKSVVLIVLKYGILIGLLMVSLSKEPIEDEYVRSVRMQSYMLAFVMGVVQALIFPFINLGAETLIGNTSSYQPTGDFFILWILLACQLLFFHVLKGRADD